MTAAPAAGGVRPTVAKSTDPFEAFTDEDCIHWLWSARYSDDGSHAQCTNCGKMRRFHPVRRRGCYSCDSCGHHVFPRVGTMFERSRVPLRTWFAAIYELERHPDTDTFALGARLGMTTAQAKRVCSRVAQAATDSGEAAELARIASAVESWNEQWHSQGKTRQSRRNETDLTRIKILDATVQVIVDRGYSDVRVSDVAQRAGLSTATVHYHFETKYELLFAALSNAMRLWFEEGDVDEEGDPVTRLGAALRHAVVASPDRTDQIVWMDFSRLALRDSRWAARLEELCLTWDARMRSIIQDGVDRGVFRCVGTVDDAVMRIQGLIDGLAERVMLAYSDSPAPRVYRLVAEAAAMELRIDAQELIEAIDAELPEPAVAPPLASETVSPFRRNRP
ncbi:TetR family transcriptional regulator (plasmid) [Nocardioides sp. R1-1]|uniref:TetR family transcriptional regulator n=1 Tax=Nocardioides sp. R1-1 TaxID=3383502 RepID=UPI0038CFEDB1